MQAQDDGGQWEIYRSIAYFFILMEHEENYHSFKDLKREIMCKDPELDLPSKAEKYPDWECGRDRPQFSLKSFDKAVEIEVETQEKFWVTNWKFPMLLNHCLQWAIQAAVKGVAAKQTNMCVYLR